MRRRLTWLVLAVTGLVVVSYTVPLAILVRNQADERARSNAEFRVQAVAQDVVDAVEVGGQLSVDTVGSEIDLPEGVTLLDSAGDLLGEAPVDVPFSEQTVVAGTSLSTYLTNGWQLSLPVVGRSGWIVVNAYVSNAELERGVNRAWAFLAGLGVALIVAALLIADRLGRSLRDPVEELAAAAYRLGEGDLDARVNQPEISELSVVADALNRMAPRLRRLLASERESVADLSHRLRTPLAALRLQAEAIDDPAEREEMVALVDRMHQSVDALIKDVRRPSQDEGSDLVEVVRKQVAFWSVLADEEGRQLVFEENDETVPVDLPAADVSDVIDVLLGNVFSHTPRGTNCRVIVGTEYGVPFLAVADDGPGFPDHIDPLRRGVSAGGSTGLGLDIARSTAERVGGDVTLTQTDGGGATVVVEFGSR